MELESFKCLNKSFGLLRLLITRYYRKTLYLLLCMMLELFLSSLPSFLYTVSLFSFNILGRWDCYVPLAFKGRKRILIRYLARETKERTLVIRFAVSVSASCPIPLDGAPSQGQVRRIALMSPSLVGRPDAAGRWEEGQDCNFERGKVSPCKAAADDDDFRDILLFSAIWQASVLFCFVFFFCLLRNDSG